MISSLSRTVPRAAAVRPRAAPNLRLWLELGVLTLYIVAALVALSLLPFRTGAAPTAAATGQPKAIPAAQTELVTIVVDDLHDSMVFSCLTTADRVSSDVITVHAADYGQLIYDLSCSTPRSAGSRDDD